MLRKSGKFFELKENYGLKKPKLSRKFKKKCDRNKYLKFFETFTSSRKLENNLEQKEPAVPKIEFNRIKN